MLIAILANTPRDREPHAVTGFWEPWSNSLYQLRLLDALLSLPPDTFNFVQLPGRRVVTVDDVSVASSTIKTLAANVQGYTWNSLDLFQVLVRLADSDSTEVRTCVREMLDKAIKISPEIVHMGLLQVPVSARSPCAFSTFASHLNRTQNGMTFDLIILASCLLCFLLVTPITSLSSCAYGRLNPRTLQMPSATFMKIILLTSRVFLTWLKISKYVILPSPSDCKH